MCLLLVDDTDFVLCEEVDRFELVGILSYKSAFFEEISDVGQALLCGVRLDIIEELGTAETC